MAPMTPPPLVAIDRRAFLRAVAAAAGSLAGGVALAACAPPGPWRALPGTSEPPASDAAGANAPRLLAAGRDTVRLGLLVSAADGLAGDGLRRGVQLYLEQIRSQVAGRALQVVAADVDAAAPDPASAAREWLESGQVDVLVSDLRGARATALAELAHARRTVLLLTSIGPAGDDRDRPSPYVFRTAGTTWQIGYPLGDWMARNLARRVFVSAADEVDGRATVAAFKEGFTQQGGSLVGETYLPPGRQDYADHLAAIGRARVDATFAFYRGADAARFVPQYAAAGLSRTVRLTGPGRLVDEPMLSAAGDAARGAISSLYWAPGLEHVENQRFLDAYRARFGAGPDVAAVGGYDAARVVVEALRHTSGETNSAARLAEAVAGVEFTSPRGPFRFDQTTHAAVHDIYVREVKDERGTLRNVVLDRYSSVPTAPESDA